MAVAPDSAGRWFREDILNDLLNERADELLARSERQSDDGAHDLAKLTAFRAMGVVDAIGVIRRFDQGRR